MAEATQATKAVILSIVRSVEAAPQLGVPEFVPTTKSEIFYRASSYFWIKDQTSMAQLDAAVVEKLDNYQSTTTTSATFSSCRPS